MPDEPEVCAIRFNIEIPSTPWDTEDALVNEIKGTIIGIERDKEVRYGSIELLLVHLPEAWYFGVPMHDLGDAHSQLLEWIVATFYDPETEEPKEEFDIEPIPRDLVVITSLKLKRKYRTVDTVVQTVETAVTFLAHNGLIVAVMDGKEHRGLKLTVAEWKALGFAKVPQSPLVFRDHCRINPYTGND